MPAKKRLMFAVGETVDDPADRRLVSSPRLPIQCTTHPFSQCYSSAISIIVTKDELKREMRSNGPSQHMCMTVRSAHANVFGR